MPIIFRSAPVTEPYTFESIGRSWQQDRITRPGGYPFYHYLQTEKGSGRIETASGAYILREQEGLLIAPFIRHSYEKTDSEWIVRFATFTGTAERSIPQIMGNRQVVFAGAGQGRLISRLIDDSIAIYGSHPPDGRQLSVKLSRLVFVTPQYLTRLFHRYLNCSAYEYLTAFRIGKAKELLITARRLEIQEIARRTGFSDASHFISVFKKAVGATPLEFRRLN